MPDNPLCPYCGTEIIQGMDECEQCGQTLSDLSIPVPTSALERGLVRDRIEVLAPKCPSTISASSPVGEAISKMAQESIGCLLIVDGEKLVGIFSEHDVVMKLGVDAPDLANHPVSQYMTLRPETLSSKDKIAYALHKMDVRGYRHVPILDESGSLSGVISIRDILDYLTSGINKG